jgi:hypothetical protein
MKGKIKYNELKKQMIVRLQEGVDTVNVIVFFLTNKEIKKRGLNADKEGFYGFRGLWYGNGTSFKSYGKIYDLSCYDSVKLVRNHIQGLTREELQKILK